MQNLRSISEKTQLACAGSAWVACCIVKNMPTSYLRGHATLSPFDSPSASLCHTRRGRPVFRQFLGKISARFVRFLLSRTLIRRRVEKRLLNTTHDSAGSSTSTRVELQGRAIVLPLGRRYSRRVTYSARSDTASKTVSCWRVSRRRGRQLCCDSPYPFCW